METKFCSKCGKELPLNMFGKRQDSKDGYTYECKECQKERMKQYYQGNKEHIAESRRQYQQDNKERIAEYHKQYQQDNREHIAECHKQYQRDNKEHIAESRRQYQQDNKEHIAEHKEQYYQDHKEHVKQHLQEHKEYITKRTKQYKEDNREHLAEHAKQYQHEHLEKFRISNQKRRALKKSLPATLTINQWKTAKLYFDNKCAYCGKELPLEQEHFIAMSKNGEYTINNIIPSCKSCNDSKYKHDFFTWYPRYKYYSKKRETKILKYLHYKNNIQQLTLAL